AARFLRGRGGIHDLVHPDLPRLLEDHAGAGVAVTPTVCLRHRGGAGRASAGAAAAAYLYSAHQPRPGICDGDGSAVWIAADAVRAGLADRIAAGAIAHGQACATAERTPYRNASDIRALIFGTDSGGHHSEPE